MCLNTVVDVWRLFRKDHNWLTTLRILVNQTAPQLWSLRTSFPISSGSIRGPSLSTLKLRKGSLTALVPRVSVLQPAPSTKPVSAVKWDSSSNFCVKTKLPQPPPVRPPTGDAGLLSPATNIKGGNLRFCSKSNIFQTNTFWSSISKPVFTNHSCVKSQLYSLFAPDRLYVIKHCQQHDPLDILDRYIKVKQRYFLFPHFE